MTTRTKKSAPHIPAELALYGSGVDGNVVHGIVKVNAKGRVPMAEVHKAMKAARMAVNDVYFFWPQADGSRRWIRYALFEHKTVWDKQPLAEIFVPEAVRTYAEWTY